jgi:hypothetical protein
MEDALITIFAAVCAVGAVAIYAAMAWAGTRQH